MVYKIKLKVDSLTVVQFSTLLFVHWPAQYIVKSD